MSRASGEARARRERLSREGKALRLTRRAQVQDALEEQGDPESAGWTSPETPTVRNTSWIHSFGSVSKLRPFFTSTKTQKLYFKQKHEQWLKNVCAVSRFSFNAHQKNKPSRLKNVRLWKTFVSGSPALCLFPPHWSPAHFPPSVSLSN